MLLQFPQNRVLGGLNLREGRRVEYHRDLSEVVINAQLIDYLLLARTESPFQDSTRSLRNKEDSTEDISVLNHHIFWLAQDWLHH